MYSDVEYEEPSGVVTIGQGEYAFTSHLVLLKDARAA